MKFVEEVITPEYAAYLLEKNGVNRPFKPNHCADLTAKMKLGLWTTSHQAIAVAFDGTLLDGQHRLTGVIWSGIPTLMVVAYNCDPETFKVIDIGKVRTASDRTGHSPVVMAITSAIITVIAKTSLKIPDQLHDLCVEAYGAETNEVAAAAQRVGMTAGLRSGFVLRLKAEPDRREQLLDELRLISLGEQSMSPQMWALQRKMRAEKLSMREVMIRTYHGLHPSRAQFTRVVPIDLDTGAKDLIDVSRRHAPELLAAVTSFSGEFNHQKMITRRKRPDGPMRSDNRDEAISGPEQ